MIVWDRTARSISALAGDGCFRFAALTTTTGLPLAAMIAGIGNSPALSSPLAIEHGVYLHNGQFCIVENGVQKTALLPVPQYGGVNQAVVFRIYRRGNRVVYTVSAAPTSAYTAAGWEAAFTPSYEGEDVDVYASESRIFEYTLLPNAARGDVVYVSLEPSYGAVHLGTMFERNTVLDPYGEGTSGSIYAAALLPLLWADAPSYMPIQFPALQCAAGDGVNGVYVEFPPISCYAPEFSGNYAAASLPAVTCLAGDNILIRENSNDCLVTMPAIGMDYEANAYNQMGFVALACKAADGNHAHSTLAPLGCAAGDEINGVYAELPALVCQATVQATHDSATVYGEVGIPLWISGDSEVINPDALPTSPLGLVASMSGVPFVVHALGTSPLGLVAGGDISSSRLAVLPTQPMRLMAGGEIRLEATGVLPTQPMGLITGGDISVIVTSVLPTDPLALVLGGRLGWRDVLAKVYCMNADTGATSEYTGFVFNSFAKIGGRYFGASEDGLFVLDADTDAGKPIAAAFGFGKLDFGSPQMKTISYCYLGAMAGQMRLDVRSHVNGRDAEYGYHSRFQRADLREVRFDLGRGLKSSYVQPTFYNCNGDDFEVDTVRFMVASSDRKI